MSVTNLTQAHINKVQIDEGIIFINFGEEDERLLGPTRGGGEFNITNTVRDIEYDGRRGKTLGLQAIEEQAASLKVVCLCCSQENLALAIPGCVVTENTGKTTITNGAGGVISSASYLKNITMFARLLDGTFKKITIFSVLHEAALDLKAVQKAEGELSFEFTAHFDPLDSTKKLWEIEDVDSLPVTE